MSRLERTLDVLGARGKQQTYHSQRVGLDERGFGQLGPIGGFRGKSVFACQGLQNRPMVEIVIVGVRVDVGQGSTVNFSVGQCSCNLRLEMLLVLK